MYSKIQIHSLHEVARATENLKRGLQSLRDQALSTLRKIEDGKNINTFGGPIGHQLPFEIERYSERLQNKIEMAKALRVADEHIQWAYEMGGVDQFSPYHEELWKKINALADAK